MEEGERSEIFRLLLWIMMLMALPVLIIGSFPVDPWLIQHLDWAGYLFGLDVLAIIGLLAWFMFKQLRKSPAINP